MDEFCPAVIVACSYGCGKMLMKSELHDHMKECELRLTTCEYCKKEVAMVEITELVSDYNCTS